MKRGSVRMIVTVAVLGAACTALAQSGEGFKLTGSTANGGGGRSTGGGFVLRGIVEPVAGESAV